MYWLLKWREEKEPPERMWEFGTHSLGNYRTCRLIFHLLKLHWLVFDVNKEKHLSEVAKMWCLCERVHLIVCVLKSTWYIIKQSRGRTWSHGWFKMFLFLPFFKNTNIFLCVVTWCTYCWAHSHGSQFNWYISCYLFWFRMLYMPSQINQFIWHLVPGSLLP